MEAEILRGEKPPPPVEKPQDKQSTAEKSKPPSTSVGEASVDVVVSEKETVNEKVTVMESSAKLSKKAKKKKKKGGAE